MILDIILDIINRRVIFQMKHVNLTELRHVLLQNPLEHSQFYREPDRKISGMETPFAGLGIYRPVSMFLRQKCREKASP